jgi:hypothetical protein
MAQWGNTDDAANSVIWAVSQLTLTANTANRNNLFANAAADAFITGVTIGQYGVDTNEISAARSEGSSNTTGDRSAHAGWVLRTIGSGGRAGRTITEVLVAMGSIGQDHEDVVYEDAYILITSQPSNGWGDSSNNDIVTFNVGATITPVTATLVYAWQYASGVGNTNFVAIAGANTAFFNEDTATLSVWANTIGNTAAGNVRCVLTATGADTRTSSTVTLAVVP